MEHVILSEGDLDIIRAMEALPGQLATYVQGDALFAAAKVVRDQARSIVPVKSGALRRSIRRGRRSQRVMTPRGIRSVPGAASYVRAGGAGAKHSVFVEYGTRRSRAKPYLQPSSVSTIARQAAAVAAGARQGYRDLARQLASRQVTARVRRVAAL